MSTPDLVRTYAPEFLLYEDDTIQPFLDLAIRSHNAAAWGSLWADAMAYYAAHLLKKSGVNADGTGLVAGAGDALAAGAVVAQKDHNLARTYANTAALSGGGASTVEEAALMETSYGRQYLSMRKTRSAGKPTLIQVTSVSD